MASDLQLSTILVSQTSIKNQLIASLASKPTWAPLIDSPFASVLIDAIASIGALDQTQILRGRQEAFRETALSPSSIYAMADTAGVRIQRKTPGYCTATITSSNASILLPSYSSFEAGGYYFFTRENIPLPQGIPTSVTLYSGKVINDSPLGIDEDYATYVAPYSGFVVSDVDTAVYVNGVSLNKVYGGVWLLNGQSGFEDRTLPDGSLAICFGNSTSGYRLNSLDSLLIQFVVTGGYADNALNVIGKNVTHIVDSTISGIITTSISGGADQPDPLTYKSLNFSNFGTDYCAVTADQHRNLAVSFSGIIDAVVLAQQQINPRAWRSQGTLYIYILGDASMTPSRITAFQQFMSKYSIYGNDIVVMNSTTVTTDITVTVYCFSWSTPSEVKANVEIAITNMFTPKRGTLDSDVHLTDILSTIAAVNGVSYSLMASPTNSVIASTVYVDTPSYSLEAGGTLAAGTYSYGIAVDAGRGISTVLNWLTITIPTNGMSVRLNWNNVPGVVRYVIYGRTVGTEGIIADSAANSFLDTGTLLVGDPPSDINPYGIRYVKLGNLSVDVQYSIR
jgi:Baseplate J-like protein